MGVALDTNYRLWDAKTATSVVGWPIASSTEPLWAYERIAAAAAEIRGCGFTAIRMPPSTKGGAGVYSDGYDKFDDYDLDGTAFGNAEMLRACVAACHAQGMQVYGDLVLHQYGGGKADGTYATKRFPKTASCFVGAPPRVPVDPVPDSTGNFAFGDMASYLHSTPGGYMYFGAIAATQWLIRTTGFDGFRVDDVKGTYAGVVQGIFSTKYLEDVVAIGEYFDGNPVMVSRYVNSIMHRRMNVLDFATKFNVGNICNNNSKVWMGQLANIGWCTVDAQTAVTFVESADTDNSPGEQIIWNKMLGYAVILTFPGYPNVYYRDWSTDPGCYGLKTKINNLIWIHEHLAQGDFVVRLDTHPQVFAHERMGYLTSPGCVCLFNNDQYHTHTVTIETRYPPNTRLHEYTGHYDTDVWTDENQRITVTVPKNDNGLSYLVFGLWITPPPFAAVPMPTTQTFFGAADLSTPQLEPGSNVVGVITAAEGSDVTLALSPALGATISMIRPDGLPLASLSSLPLNGEYSILVALPETAAPSDFTLTVNYMGV